MRHIVCTRTLARRSADMIGADCDLAAALAQSKEPAWVESRGEANELAAQRPVPRPLSSAFRQACREGADDDRIRHLV
jgi:hypothetical protein